MTAGPPRVSVIMIFLDAERFIVEAIESVRSQTLPDWELLLVDDGSSDASTEIARGYARAHPHIVYLEHPGHRNRGMGASRALALQHASGEFIAMLDSDDVWLSRHLERRIGELESCPRAAMAFGPAFHWFGWETGDPEDPRDEFQTVGLRPDRIVEAPRMLQRIMERRAEPPSPCSVLIRRAAAEAVGGFDEVFTGLYEDQAFFAKIFARYPVWLSSEVWDKYRQHPDSSCHVAAAAGERDPDLFSPERQTFLEWLGAHLEELPQLGDIRRRVRRELWLFEYPRLYMARQRVRLWWASTRPKLRHAVWSVIFAVGRTIAPAGVRDRAWRALRSRRPRPSLGGSIETEVETDGV